MAQSEETDELNLLGEPLPVELMNTVRSGESRIPEDLLAGGGAGAWMRAVQHRLPTTMDDGVSTLRNDSGVSPADGRLRDLRDALRVLAADATRDPRYPTASKKTRDSAVATLNRMSRTAPTWPELTWPPDRDPFRALASRTTSTELLVALVAHEAVELFTDPQRSRLRPCVSPGCHRYFLKHHSRREWCSSACGNRARVARHHRRHSTANRPHDGTV
jgi:predicted RNA-binding Zn ribbon-like protein